MNHHAPCRLAGRPRTASVAFSIVGRVHHHPFGRGEGGFQIFAFFYFVFSLDHPARLIDSPASLAWRAAGHVCPRGHPRERQHRRAFDGAVRVVQSIRRGQTQRGQHPLQLQTRLQTSVSSQAPFPGGGGCRRALHQARVYKTQSARLPLPSPQPYQCPMRQATFPACP